MSSTLQDISQLRWNHQHHQPKNTTTSDHQSLFITIGIPIQSTNCPPISLAFAIAKRDCASWVGHLTSWISHATGWNFHHAEVVCFPWFYTKSWSDFSVPRVHSSQNPLLRMLRIWTSEPVNLRTIPTQPLWSSWEQLQQLLSDIQPLKKVQPWTSIILTRKSSWSIATAFCQTQSTLETIHKSIHTRINSNNHKSVWCQT